MRWCAFRLPCCVNNLLHTLQLNGCSPLCVGVLMSFRLPWCVKCCEPGVRIPNCRRQGASMQIRISKKHECVPSARNYNIECHVVYVAHTDHHRTSALTSFISGPQMLSTVCVLKSFRLPCSVNDLLHTSQVNRCSPLCVCWCPSDYPAVWMNYYTHHRSTDALHCVCADVPSDYPDVWRTYYTHHT